MYAIIKSGSKQYRVEKGDRIEVERLPQKAGEEIALKEVLFIGDGDKYQADRQVLHDASVIARVIGERKGRKVISFDYRNKHRRRTTHGHRQLHTHLEIKDILLSSQSADVSSQESVVGSQESVASSQPLVVGSQESAVSSQPSVAGDQPPVVSSERPDQESAI